jgi:hypothetical protein
MFVHKMLAIALIPPRLLGTVARTGATVRARPTPLAGPTTRRLQCWL